jgi:cyclopropane fatty-acyl-phospholipid synthase-like methyltransferase
VVGLDIDPEILTLARDKVRRCGVRVDLALGSATQPPFEPRSFDRVISMRVFHHLTTDDKRRALRAARELLVAGGELHLADWGKPRTRWAAIAFGLVRHFDGKAVTEANVQGALPELMREAGFSHVVEPASRRRSMERCRSTEERPRDCTPNAIHR